MMFRDRIHAGEMLGDRLSEILPSFQLPRPINALSTVVLGLPRGGVPVAREVAKKLSLPLDIIVVRKLGVPGQEELAMGAVASNDAEYLNEDLIQGMRIDRATVERVRLKKKAEVNQRERVFMRGREHIDLTDKNTILVDDGLATGATMKAAVQSIRSKKPARIIVAVPVAPHGTLTELRGLADYVVCLTEPALFYGVGGAYHVFAQTSDEEVMSILQHN